MKFVLYATLLAGSVPFLRRGGRAIWGKIQCNEVNPSTTKKTKSSVYLDISQKPNPLFFSFGYKMV
uniref:Uncharacterized protein n=1 Tax=Arion vulgaris TaxID=1028688 RepID=A0A0B7AYM3_9EUPU